MEEAWNKIMNSIINAPNIKAHIFDLDGTLIDSMGFWHQIDIDYLARRGISLPHNYHEYVENTTPLNPLETAAYAIDFFGLNDTPEEILLEWNQQAAAAYASAIPLKSYAKEFLHSLRNLGTKMAIASSAPSVLCIPALRNHDIEHLFDAVALSEEVGYGKFKPDVFLLATKRLGVDPTDCIMYEDNLTAIKTAKSIGMTVCAVYDEFSKRNWEEIQEISDYVVYDFRF